MSDQATYGIAITASNKTAKGRKAAEKELGAIPKHVSAVTRRAADSDERYLGRSRRSILRTFGEVERASSRAFGGRSISSGVAGRLGAIRSAASATGSGLGEAAAAGGVLQTTLGGLGVVAGATVGVLAAAAYGAFKLANGWAKGAASIGRTAEIIGIGTKALQEFTAAAERQGVDKGTAGSAIGGISKTLNDARYGRNNDALALLGKLGVKMQLNADGTVNVDAMLPAIADAIGRQNSSGRRTVAGILGIPEAALPAFSQGGKALQADMSDASVHAGVLSDADIATGKRVARKGVIAGQLGERAMMMAGGATAGVVEHGYDAIISGGQAITDGANSFFGTVTRDFAPAARTNLRAADKMERAAGQISSARSGLNAGVLNLSPKDVVDLKKTVQTEWNGRSQSQGEGIIDTILNRQASGHWGRTVADVVNARKQFSDINGPIAWRNGRRSVDDISMRRVTGKTSELVDRYLQARARGTRSAVGDNLNYANPNYSDRRNLSWINRLDGPVLGSGQSIHRHGTVPELDRYRPGGFSVGLPGQQQEIPVKVEIEMRGAPPGTRAKVSAGNGPKPAISRSMSDYVPVRGG